MQNLENKAAAQKIHFSAKLNFNGRIGWSIVKVTGSKKTGRTYELASDYLGSLHTAAEIANSLNSDFYRHGCI